jgi:HEAT repeat protein
VRRAAATLLAIVLAVGPAAAEWSGGVDDAILALFTAARAGNETATTQAASVVVSFGPAAAASLARSLSDRTPQELVWALRCLREIGSDTVKDTVFGLCSHSDAAVRADAVIASGMLGKSAAVPFLQRAAADPDDTVRRRAYDGLIEYGCQADGTLVIGVNGVVAKDFWVVLQAFQILDGQKKPERGADRVVVELAKVVGKLDDRNAEACFDFLVRRAGADCGPVVESALGASQRCVVIAALRAAGRLRLASARLPATKLAKNSEIPVSIVAIDCVAQINDPDSLPALVDLLERATDPLQVDAVAVALRRMTSRLYGTDVSLWRKYLAGKLR